jgi:hypothetical protein
MSDALLSRLRNRWGQDLSARCDEAADRIEALEAALRQIETWALEDNQPQHLESLILKMGSVARAALEGK